MYGQTSVEHDKPVGCLTDDDSNLGPVKLGDLVWRSALRNRAARDVEIGGGASFDHLVEDLNNTGTMSTDIGFHVGPSIDDPYAAGWAEILSNGYLQIRTSLTGWTLVVGSTADARGDRFVVHDDGSLHFGDGATAADTTLKRADTGVLEIPQVGGGLKLTSPNGLTTKTITINNAGAIALL